MPSDILQMTHAELVALSRDNADRYDARAAEHEAKGETAEAEKLRQWARSSRQEADFQSGAVANRL